MILSVEIDETAIVQQKRALEAALSTNPKTEAALRKVIRKAILEARAKTVAGIRGVLHSDPRGAANAVRSTVYKKVLGANVNLFSYRRRAAGATSYKPPRKLDAHPHQRGGNRRKRSPETEKVMAYGPLDRGFILRYVNTGTGQRQTRYGNRGSITARHFFRALGDKAVAQAAVNLNTLIDEELEKLMKKAE